MEERKLHHEGRQFGSAHDDYVLSPAWLCTPQIKLETDPSVHDRTLPQYLHSTNSNCIVNQGPLRYVGAELHTKSIPSLSNTPSGYFRRKMSNGVSTHVDGYSEHAHLNQRSTSQLPEALPDQRGTTVKFDSSAAEGTQQQGCEQPKFNDYGDSTEWHVPRDANCHAESQLAPESDQQCVSSNGGDNRVLAFDPEVGQSFKCDSKAPYDLTLRTKTPSSTEECPRAVSREDVPEVQSKCSPKPQTCKVCGKVLSSPSSYYVHMKLHSGNKPYACTICEASFCRKPYLEVHMRTHTGERPFECSTCNKRFTQKSSLNTHKRVHTGERPYSCDICHKTFAVKSYVTAHRWSHVSEKPLGCHRCNLTFTSKNLFALHMRTHVDQNHECHICGRTFMKDAYLIRHQNKVHRDGHPQVPQTRSPSLSPRSGS